MAKIFLEQNVLDAARERISMVFDNFENIIVSISGGKDSTALYWLAMEEAKKRQKPIGIFFLDQEAEYQATIDQIENLMQHPLAIPMWYQVPIRMTNATSFQKDMLYAWGKGENWIREKHPMAIHSIERKYPKRFYNFFHWLESTTKDTAFLIGLRAEEGINRVRAAIKNPGWNNVMWSKKTKSLSTFRFYPIYDWGMGDVWKYIYENGFGYNAIYDKMYSANHGVYNTMRVSNLIHEKSFYCLADLQTLEPETYEKMLKRLDGIHCAAHYADREYIYDTSTLPESFKTWKEYRDYLLASTPYEMQHRFVNRFAKQPETEYVFRQQVKQLLINDWENNVPIKKKPDRQELLEKWREIL